jgi:hypothetical protein
VIAKAMTEGIGLLRAPQRIVPLIGKLVSDRMRISFEQRHLYSYATIKRDSGEALNSSLRWVLDAQRPDGGIAAYYSLLTGYSAAYPEVTGYIVPTLYDFSRAKDDQGAAAAAERATGWLLSLQMPTGAFPGGLHDGFPRGDTQPSVFNTGQILQGLVRSLISDTDRSETIQIGPSPPAIG